MGFFVMCILLLMPLATNRKGAGFFDHEGERQLGLPSQAVIP